MKQFEEIFERFERDWNKKPRPKIEDYVSQVPEPQRGSALRELLVLEWDLLREEGQSVSLSGYIERFPELREYVLAAINEEQVTQTKWGSSATHSTELSLNWESITQLNVRGRLDQIRFLAKVGLGEVYTALDRDLNRTVAVKRIKRNASSRVSSVAESFFGGVPHDRIRTQQACDSSRYQARPHHAWEIR
jgi:hypothetical protein